MKAETFPVPCYLSWLTVFGKGGKTTEKFPGMLHNKSLKKSKTKRSEKLLKLILFKNKKKLRKTETLFRINLFYLPEEHPDIWTTFYREAKSIIIICLRFPITQKYHFFMPPLN